MFAIQYNSIGLINTQYRCDYTRAHAGHVMLQPARASPSVVSKQSKCKCFSQVQRVFIVKHYLASLSYLTCQNDFRDIFPDSPVPNKSSMSRLVNRFHAPVCIRHGEKCECMHRWTRWTFPTLNITLFSDFIVIYSMKNRTCVRNGLRDFSITL
jgi:hypothetical protein